MNRVSVVEGSVEYIYADIKSDRVLDTQAVFMSVSATDDPDTWTTAAWTGTAARSRSARILLDGTLSEGTYTVFAKITDSPEAPIIRVGYLNIT